MQDNSKSKGKAIRKGHAGRGHLPRGMEIVYEDDDLLVVNKPAGLLTMGTEDKKIGTAYYYLMDYVRKGGGNTRARIFIVHRLDKLTSGVLVFAKNEEVKLKLQADWEKTKKKYLAVVHGQFVKKEGVITSYLAENKAFVMYSTKDPAKGKLSHTAYKVLQESRRFSLVEVDLLTGRKNQIRVHMTDVGHPVVGDDKYGKANGVYKRLALHAKSISFVHPVTGKTMMFETRTPHYFGTLMESHRSQVTSHKQEKTVRAEKV